MQNNLAGQIQLARDFKSKPYADRNNHERAYPLFKDAVAKVLTMIRSPEGSQKSSQLKKLAQQLLTEAEQCERPRQQSLPPTARRRCQSQLNEYERNIEAEVLDQSPPTRWDDIAGLDFAKSQLQEAIIMPSLYPHVYTGIRAPPKGILLFGPPGTGKTMLARAVAHESGACFLSISASSLTSKFFGEAEKLVRAMFAIAQRRQPAVVFIDEVDSILTSRSEGQHEASRRLQTEFLVQMDGVRSDSEDRVVIVAATNRPDSLDEAVIRRFTKRFLIDLPEPQTRMIIFRHMMSKVAASLSNADYNKLVSNTAFYSGSDLTALCKEAAMVPLRGLSPADLAGNRIPPVTLKSFQVALKVIRPSVSKQRLKFYADWNNAYGSN